MTTRKHIVATLFPLLMVAGQGMCQSSQPESLADAARNSRASKKAVLVVNEDTISSIGGVVSVVGQEPVRAAADASAPAQAAQPASATPASNQATPAADTPQIADLKRQLDARRQELDGWKWSVKHYQDLLATETSEFRRETYQSALANDQANVQQSQKDVDAAQAALDKARVQQAAQ